LSRRDKRSSRKDAPWSPVAQLFATAVRHHQAGQFADADLHYRQALAIDPKHAPSLHYLGVLAHQAGRNESAVDLIGKAIALEPKDAQSRYNIALALRALGRNEDALAHLRRTVGLKPDFAEAHLHLGNALRDTGDAKAAAGCYARVLQLQPGAAEAHFRLAELHAADARYDEAAAGYARALSLKGDHAPAHNALGSLLMTLGRAAEAVAHFQASVRSDPQLTDAYLNLGGALLRHGTLYDALGVINRTFELGLAETRAADALGLVRQALAIEESVDTRTLFVQCVRSLRTVPDIAGIRELMIRALTEPWGRPADLSAAATSLIIKDKAIGNCDALLRALLTSACIRDVALERLLAGARAALLGTALGGTPADEDAVALACALASQCFINEYAFACTDVELEQARRLRDLRDITPLKLAALASYEPLHALPDADALLARDWPEAIDALLDLQLRRPREEARIRETIPAVTPITDDVSLKVRAQYEQNPYPRWIKTAPIGHAATLDSYLAKFPAFRALGAAAPDVLIAGCGTGQHVATVVLQFTGLNILAVDLSRASLAYAQRATQSLGLTGIDYAQADITALGALGRSFDMIDSSGVLHHLADPFAGWRILLSLLRPGGVMRLGLYSALGRQDVAAVRQYVAARGYSGQAASIRQCRQELMGFAPGTPQRVIAETSDFFSTSECRDLLFHVQEHTLTLPQIADFLAAEALTFLGFEGCAKGCQRYAQLFPGDAAMADLGRWTRIEGENPRLFVNMYQFWIQKPR
jgi:tetratricopeptide (TPR) repeat protein